MSRRNRRQQEELEDLTAGAGLQDPAGSTSDSAEEDDVIAPTKSQSTFAALSASSILQSEDVEDDGSDSDEADISAIQPANKKKKPKKKKKRKPAAAEQTGDGDEEASVAAEEPPIEASAPTSQDATPSKKSKKKGKGKKQDGKVAPPEEEEDGLDEIDRALKQLGGPSAGSAAMPSASPAQVVANATTSRIRSLLSITATNLDADAELKRFFGSKVVQSSLASSSGPQIRGARALNPHHALNRQLGKGGMLAKPAQGWPPIAFSKSGLGMEVVHAEGSGNSEPTWTYEHTRSYVEVTHMYLEAVASMDPNQLMALLQVHPYHIETLLGLSEMAAAQGDAGMSQDFLSRALYAYEKAMLPGFLNGLQNGNSRLDFGKIENRGLFRAVQKRIESLSKRGTWRTLHEHAKLLYALSPYDDPYGALLYLDFTAPKCKQWAWFLDFIDELPTSLERSGHASHLQLDAYPGLWFAKALCRWQIETEEKDENHEQSTKDLQAAVKRYPLTAVMLVEKLDRSPPPEIAKLENALPQDGFSTQPSYILQLLSALYVHRSSTLWNEPDLLAFLLTTVRSTVPSFTSSSSDSDSDIAFGRNLWSTSLYSKNGVPEGILRHVLVSDVQSLKSYLPNSVLNSMSFTYDPLPPGPGFDDAYFSKLYDGANGSRSRRAPGGRQGPGRGPANGGGGGENGFVQRLLQYLQSGQAGQAGGMDADTEAALIAQLEQFQQAGGARDGPPGGFPGGAGEGDAGQAGGIVDFFRGLWGGENAPPAGETGGVEGEQDDMDESGSEVDDETRP